MRPPTDFLSEHALDDIADSLAARGFHIEVEALPPWLVRALQTEALVLENGNAFRPAAIGRETDRQQVEDIRSDDIHWLDAAQADAWFEFMERLRLGLNRRLFLGLFDYECHFARYAPGAFYGKHLDAFSGHRNRVLSTVLYLNDAWRDGDGGDLLLYDGDGRTLLHRVSPRLNTLVLFLSERFPHEVLPAIRPRLSLAGWYRVNTSTGQVVDPPA